MSIARSHVRAMASAGSLKTRQADPIKAVRERNIPYRKVALAAFSGQPTPDAVLQAMTENRGHRNNLLGDFDRIGIGYATDQDGTPYWSVVFLRSPDR